MRFINGLLRALISFGCAILILTVSVFVFGGGVFAAGEDLSETSDESQVQEKGLETKIVTATVYDGDAQITRRGEIELGVGNFRLVCEDLPLDFVKSSLHVEGRGMKGAKITGIDMERVDKKKFNSKKYGKLVEKLINLTNKRLDTTIKHNVIVKRKRFVSAFTNFSLDKAQEKLSEETFSITDWTKIIDFFENENLDTETRLSALKREIDELAEKISVAREKIGRMNMGEEKGDAVVINCQVIEPGKMTVDIVYMISNAIWSPEYRCCYRKDENVMELSYSARIWQATGEDWKDVSVLLSTAKPAIGAAPPKMYPLFLNANNGEIAGMVKDALTGEPLRWVNIVFGDGLGGFTLEDGSFRITAVPAGTYTVKLMMMGYKSWEKKKVVIHPGKATMLNVALKGTIVDKTEEILVRAVKKQIDVKSSGIRHSVDRRDLSVLPVDNIDEALALKTGIVKTGRGLGRRYSTRKPAIPYMEADISKSEFAANLKIQKPVTLESGSEPKRSLVLKREFDGEFSLHSLPRFSEHVYLKGKFKNRLELPLITGVGQIYVESITDKDSHRISDFVGREKIAPVASGEDFEVHFGIDQDIKVNHKLVKKENLSGENSDKTKIRYYYTITLENFKKDTARVHLTDRIPVSAMKRIKVDDVEIEPEPDEKGEDGILNWVIVLPSGGKKEIKIEYKVEFPAIWTTKQLSLD